MTEHETSVEIVEAGVTTFRSTCSCSWRHLIPRTDYATAVIDGAAHRVEQEEAEVEHRCKVVAFVSSEGDGRILFSAVCQADSCGYSAPARDAAEARGKAGDHYDLNVPRSVALDQLRDVSFLTK